MSKLLDWQSVRAYLEERRRTVIDEIRHYPGPITGCDAQFNHLTEERRLLNAELARLESALREREDSPAAFIRSSPILDASFGGQVSSS